MKATLLKRIESLEERRASAMRIEDRRSEKEKILSTALAVAFVLRVGVNAKEELEEADGSMAPKRREKLTEQVALARRIAETLASNRK